MANDRVEGDLLACESPDVRRIAGALLSAGIDSAPLEVIERAATCIALEKHRSNRSRAAEALGISVRTLQRKLKIWARQAAKSRGEARG